MAEREIWSSMKKIEFHEQKYYIVSPKEKRIVENVSGVERTNE
jgi:hypothetical protein